MSAWIPAALPWKFGLDIRLTETSQRQELRRVSCWGKGFMKFCCDIVLSIKSTSSLQMVQ
ncbi:hypothetical protein ARMSODRAFT_961778 [Armillaria solidipes]|uniref:Uncharacterized protein n=1 Tax=Armillaria solidipes TaxID=1076256 RepID=A0A2H3B4I7_9AGAR|nr:hypothetical protein ARMSODRAFT_961778 [Armillaria solidipes]